MTLPLNVVLSIVLTSTDNLQNALKSHLLNLGRIQQGIACLKVERLENYKYKKQMYESVDTHICFFLFITDSNLLEYHVYLYLHIIIHYISYL